MKIACSSPRSKQREQKIFETKQTLKVQEYLSAPNEIDQSGPSFWVGSSEKSPVAVGTALASVSEKDKWLWSYILCLWMYDLTKKSTCTMIVSVKTELNEEQRFVIEVVY